MSRCELSKAGIRDPHLVRSYRLTRRLNAHYGKTYFLATYLLPAARRPHIHALYGFARYVDEVVDRVEGTTVHTRQLRLAHCSDQFFADLERGHSDHPVYAATIHTIGRFRIDHEYFRAFFRSMQMDLTVDRYDSFEDLSTYVYGSAAVIGAQVVRVLAPESLAALPYAETLGVAFQLANFLRDVNEDLDRGRIYLPLDELSRFGVTEQMLQRRQMTPELREALSWQADRVRKLSEQAQPGIKLLPPRVQPGIETARVLYCGIVDELARHDYDVFAIRASVPLTTRLLTATRIQAQAWRA